LYTAFAAFGSGLASRIHLAIALAATLAPSPRRHRRRLRPSPPPPSASSSVAAIASSTDKGSGLAEFGFALRHRAACAQPTDQREVSNTVSFLEFAPLGRPRPRRSTPALEQPESNSLPTAALRASGWPDPLG